ncbi:MAG: hypothetical protein LBV19_08225 [Streptococcaceae bacterium]|jgi:hypothetical protein|nr:hypothetical protein [Streptococcaceae bacterium]
MVTDKQLKDLNELAYGVNPDYKKDGKDFQNINEGKPFEIGGKKYQVIATQNNQQSTGTYVDPKTGISRPITGAGSGFQGMAVAPIINGQPDLSQTIVVAAGTDSTEVPFGPDGLSADQRLITGTSGQFNEAKAFVKEVAKIDGVTVAQLSGYSQSAYMLKIGKEGIVMKKKILLIFTGLLILFSLGGCNMTTEHTNTDGQITYLKAHEKEWTDAIKSENPHITSVQFDWKSVEVGTIGNGTPQGGGTILNLEGKFNNIEQSHVSITFELKNENSMPDGSYYIDDISILRDGGWNNYEG